MQKPKTMRQLFLISTAVLCLTVAYGQTQITFQKAIGDTNLEEGISIIQSTDGGYAIAGNTWSFGPGFQDFYVIKLDSIENLQWSKAVGGTNQETCLSLTHSNDGGFAVVGRTYSFGAGSSDIYLVKLDSNGNLQWTKTIGDFSAEIGNSIIQANDGGYVVCGATGSYDGGLGDVYVVKLNGSGNLLWTKTIGSSNGVDNGNSIIQTNDGGFAIAGYTGSFGAGNADVYVIKLDSIGNLQWTRTVGGSGQDFGYSIIQTIDGGYAIGGETSSFGQYDVYIIKLDNAGNLQWTRTVGGVGLDGGNSIVEANDKGLVINGGTSSFGAGMFDLYLVKLDSIGNLQFAKTIGTPNNEMYGGLTKTNDGGFAMVGSTDAFGSGNKDVYVVKLDANGNTCMGMGSGGVVNSGGLVSSGGTIGSGGTTGTGGIIMSGGILTNICTNVGINEYQNVSSINIYPNPLSSSTTLQTDKVFKDATVSVYNLYGQTVAQIKNLSGQTITFNRDNLSSGLYFVRLTEENNPDGYRGIAVDKLVITD